MTPSMRKLSYPLFPFYLRFVGFLIIAGSIVAAITVVDYSDPEDAASTLGGLLAFLAIGMVLASFRNNVYILNSSYLIKHYKILGLGVSKEKVKIPKNVSGLLLKTKLKTGRGYVKAAVGFGYTIKSTDIYFLVNGNTIPVIKTDKRRALQIADFLKSELSVDYIVDDSSEPAK